MPYGKKSMKMGSGDTTYASMAMKGRKGGKMKLAKARRAASPAKGPSCASPM